MSRGPVGTRTPGRRKTMPPDEHNEAERIVLLSIYAPSSPNRSNDDWIEGRTRLMKAVFLASKKLEEELGRTTDVPFIAGKYGPFSKAVLEAIETLQEQELIEVEERTRPGAADRHRLTDRGLRVARRYWENLSGEEREVLGWIKRRHVAQSLDRLLSFVYKRYPHFTSRSEIADEYLH